ncbi:MAG TPA: serine O-acetyltransferase [Chthoniobacterales bacterium]|jgi:serine O-acetyltransferase
MEPLPNDPAEALLRTYSAGGGINYLAAAATLPSRPAIDAACVDLLSLLFPGFHGAPLTDPGDLPDVTRIRIRSLRARLHPEMCKSLARRRESGSVEAEAEEILGNFFAQLASVREMLWSDLDAAYEGDPSASSFEEVILAFPSLEAIAIQRMAHILYQANLPLIPRMMTEWAHGRTGIDIHPGAKIGSHFFIDHGTGVVIGETCVIGSRVKLYHGVTLGARSFEKDEKGHIKKGGERHPRVEDGVTIYPNSTVLGGETVIGARSTIGGNVFLTHSVPPDSLVSYEANQLQVVHKMPRQKLQPNERPNESPVA